MDLDKGIRKSRNITFRLSDETYDQVERAAEASGDDPNSWCRKAALNQMNEGHTFTKNEYVIYREIALLRFLLGHGFKLLFSRNEASAAAWKKFTDQANTRSEEIINHLLSSERWNP